VATTAVIPTNGVLDQMAMDYVAGGVAHAVDFAAKAANVAAWCGVSDGDGEMNMNEDGDEEEEENGENWGG